MMSNQPRDSPSVTFQVDPHLKNIYNKEQFGVVLVAAWPPNKSFLEGYDTFINKVKECFDPIDLMLRVEDNDDDDDDDDDVQEEESVMKQGETDVQTKSQMSSPNVYLYPPQHLHITVATFHPFSKPFYENTDTNATDKAAGIRTDKVTDTSSSAEKNHELYSKACQKITQNAMQRSDWPKYRFSIEVEGAQIGEKAGIILWKDASSCNKDKQYGDEDTDTDTDKDEQGQQDQQKHKQQQGGSFHLMRNILKEEYEKAMMDVMPMTDKNGRTSKTTTDTKQNIPKGKELIIPNIIHSTFLRFGSKPQTNGKVIQDKFQSLLHENHNMTKIFLNNNNRSGICIDGVKLVVENRAYMHIPFDEDHVLESFELA